MKRKRNEAQKASDLKPDFEHKPNSQQIMIYETTKQLLKSIPQSQIWRRE